MQGKVHADAMAAVYVGIDVCKERLDVYLHPLGERLAVANDAGGWRHLRSRLAGLAPRVAMLVMGDASAKKAIEQWMGDRLIARLAWDAASDSALSLPGPTISRRKQNRQ